MEGLLSWPSIHVGWWGFFLHQRVRPFNLFLIQLYKEGDSMDTDGSGACSVALIFGGSSMGSIGSR